MAGGNAVPSADGGWPVDESISNGGGRSTRNGWWSVDETSGGASWPFMASRRDDEAAGRFMVSRRDDEAAGRFMASSRDDEAGRFMAPTVCK